MFYYNIQVKNWLFYLIGFGSYVIISQAQCENPKTLINT